MSDRRKKVLMLVTLGEMGGAQKYVKDVATGLKDEYGITIASGVETGDDLLSWAREENIRTVHFPSLKRGLAFGTLPALSDFPFWIDLVRHMRAERYDIVHLNSSKVGYLGALASFFAPHTKAVFTVHGWAFEDPTVGGGWKKWLWVVVIKFGAYFTDRIIVLSEAQLDAARRYHIASPRKLYRIYNGFDPRSVTFLSRARARAWLRENAGIDLSAPVVGTIANSYYTKDLNTLMGALKLVRAPEAHLVIIGSEGSQPHRELVERAVRLGVRPRVHLLGAVKNAARYLKAFDVYAISSVKEGLPFSLLEAMAAGVPIVATPVGGNAEVLFHDPKNPAALSVPVSNPKRLAEALDTILDNPSSAQKLTRNARERLKAFSHNEMLERTQWVYELP